MATCIALAAPVLVQSMHINHVMSDISTFSLTSSPGKIIIIIIAV
jgi:hypothetical protein